MTQSGSPTPARAAATVASKPPVASRTTRATGRSLRRPVRLSRPLASRDAQGLTRRSEMDVEAIFGHVDADEDGGRFVHDPTLRMRAQAQAGCPGSGLRRWGPHQALSRVCKPK